MARMKAQGASTHPRTEDLVLMEELVRASLRVNPSLAENPSNTREVIAHLANEVSETGPLESPNRRSSQNITQRVTQKLNARRDDPPAPPARAARASNISFFFENKAQTFAENLELLEDRRARLDAEESAMTQQTLDEIVDFLALAAESKAQAEAVLVQFADLVRRLGVSRRDILARAHRRRQGGPVRLEAVR